MSPYNFRYFTSSSHLLYFSHSILWLYFMFSLIFCYLEAIYFLSGACQNKKMHIPNISITGRWAYSIKICLSNLAGGSRTITNLTESWMLSRHLYRVSQHTLVWRPLFRNMLKKEKIIKNVWLKPLMCIKDSD